MSPARLLILSAAALLAACATTAPYQPLKKGVGYSEQQLESNRFRVSFAGNGATPKDTVENYMLYRAAEITLERGYDGFRITSRDTQLAPQSGGSGVSLGIGGFGFGSHTGGGVGVGVPIGGGSSGEYTSTADILMFRGARPPNDNNAYSARELKENLEARVRPPAKAS